MPDRKPEPWESGAAAPFLWIETAQGNVEMSALGALVERGHTNLGKARPPRFGARLAASEGSRGRGGLTNVSVFQRRRYAGAVGDAGDSWSAKAAGRGAPVARLRVLDEGHLSGNDADLGRAHRHPRRLCRRGQLAQPRVFPLFPRELLDFEVGVTLAAESADRGGRPDFTPADAVTHPFVFETKSTNLGAQLRGLDQQVLRYLTGSRQRIKRVVLI
jgi:hypothetical protein